MAGKHGCAVLHDYERRDRVEEPSGCEDAGVRIEPAAGHRTGRAYCERDLPTVQPGRQRYDQPVSSCTAAVADHSDVAARASSRPTDGNLPEERDSGCTAV